MNNEQNLNENGDFETAPTFTLYDEAGNPSEFVLLARTEYEGKLYYALTELSDAESYVILEVREDGEDILLETVEDDATFDAVAELFDELLSDEYDYDND